MPWHPVAACWVALDDWASKGLPAIDSQSNKHCGRHMQVAWGAPLSTTLMFWIERWTFFRRQLQIRSRVCRKPVHFRRSTAPARIREGQQPSATAAQHRWSGIGLTEFAGKFSCVYRCLVNHGCSRTALNVNDCAICEKKKESEQMQMVHWEGGESVNDDACGGKEEWYIVVRREKRKCVFFCSSFCVCCCWFT